MIEIAFDPTLCGLSKLISDRGNVGLVDVCNGKAADVDHSIDAGRLITGRVAIEESPHTRMLESSVCGLL
jgi:hypothetical protein